MQVPIIDDHQVIMLFVFSQQLFPILVRVVKEADGQNVLGVLVQMLSHLDVVYQVTHNYHIVSCE